MQSIMDNEIDGEVLIMEPHSFEEALGAIQALWSGKSVLLNLTMMTPEQAQRAVDFIAGGIYALDGYLERLTESIFLFTPSCIPITKQESVVHQVSQPQMPLAQSAASTPIWTSASMRIA